MARAIRIAAGQVSASAELNDSKTATVVTPASRSDEIRPASPVNVVGRVSGDATVFKKVRAGTRVTLERGGS
jgi:hypothetical protein